MKKVQPKVTPLINKLMKEYEKPARPRVFLRRKRDKKKEKIMNYLIDYMWDTQPIQMYTTTFTHLHFSNGFDTKKKTRHACLLNGYWCLKNALTYPQDLIPYLKFKIKL